MNSSWNKQILLLAMTTVAVAVIGIVSTEKIIFASLFMPVIFILILSYLEKDLSISVKLHFPNLMKVDDERTVQVQVKIKKGFGLINMQLPVYSEMEILDGTNVHILFKGFKEREMTFEYRIRSTRRGFFKWSNAVFEYIPAIGSKRRQTVEFPVASILEVDPGISLLSRSQFQLRTNKNTPRNSVTRIGPPTHEFESIREYQPGDPFKSINWKSSARNLHREALMVNVYEREGLKNFIFLVDSSPFMGSGSREENPLEYSIKLVLSGTRYLLSKSYNVGFWPIKSNQLRRVEYVIPSSGLDTFNQIRRSLLLMEYKKIIDVQRSIDRNLARILLETRPKVMVLTSLQKGNISRIRDLTGVISRFKTVPTIVDIRPESIMAKNIDRRLSMIFAYSGKNVSSYGESVSGSRVIRWDPIASSLGKIAYQLAREAGW